MTEDCPEKLEASTDGGTDQPLIQQQAPAAPTTSVSPANARDLLNKSVLLMDGNLRSRESRARAMRTMGLHVDCVADTQAGRVRLAAEKYNLVLVDPGRDTEAAESWVEEIRSRNSRQLVGFLVGTPLLIAKSLSGADHRVRPAPASSTAAPAEPPIAPAAVRLDFGQMIRKAEAERMP